MAKTALDPEACKRVLTQLMTRKEIQLRDQKPLELQPLTPIEKFKPASPCAADWEGMLGANRVRFCKLCKQQVYDFSSIDKAEAEDLIFQREGKRNPLLYKRRDGKFLTTDCSVGANRKRTMIISIIFGVLLLVGVLAFLILNPHPKQPTAPAADVKVSKSAAMIKTPKAVQTVPKSDNATRTQASFSFPAPATPNGSQSLQAPQPPPRTVYPWERKK